MGRKLRASISAENSPNFYIYIHSQEMITVYIVRHSLMAGEPRFTGEGVWGWKSEIATKARYVD